MSELSAARILEMFQEKMDEGEIADALVAHTKGQSVKRVYTVDKAGNQHLSRVEVIERHKDRATGLMFANEALDLGMDKQISAAARQKRLQVAHQQVASPEVDEGIIAVRR
jgi:hypothetical protein